MPNGNPAGRKHCTLAYNVITLGIICGQAAVGAPDVTEAHADCLVRHEGREGRGEVEEQVGERVGNGTRMNERREAWRITFEVDGLEAVLSDAFCLELVGVKIVYLCTFLNEFRYKNKLWSCNVGSHW